MRVIARGPLQAGSVYLEALRTRVPKVWTERPAEGQKGQNDQKPLVFQRFCENEETANLKFF